MNISKKFSTKAKNVGTFFLFAGPSLFFFVMAILVPLVYGVYLTFTDWNGISKEKNIVGIENYLTAFTDLEFAFVDYGIYRNFRCTGQLYCISSGQTCDQWCSFSELLQGIFLYT